jgi:hypothetical protein
MDTFLEERERPNWEWSRAQLGTLVPRGTSATTVKNARLTLNVEANISNILHLFNKCFLTS